MPSDKERTNNLEPKIWDIVPEEFEHNKSLDGFKESIKMWIPIYD